MYVFTKYARFMITVHSGSRPRLALAIGKYFSILIVEYHIYYPMVSLPKLIFT